jgi:hypothetical protein
MNRKTMPLAVSMAAAATLALSASFGPALGDVSESWIAASGGNWANAAKWSPNTNYPNNGTPAGTDYQASISLPGSKAYTVTVNSNIAVDALTVNSPNATMDIASGGLLTVGSLDTNNGTFEVMAGGTLAAANSSAVYTIGPNGQFELVSGTITGGTLSASGQTFDLVSGALNGVTLNTPNITTGFPNEVPLDITDNLTGVGQTISIGGPAEALIFDGPSQAINDIAIGGGDDNVTTLQVGGANSSGAVTLTVDSNASVGVSSGLLLVTGYNNHGAAVNNGTMSST